MFEFLKFTKISQEVAEFANLLFFEKGNEEEFYSQEIQNIVEWTASNTSSQSTVDTQITSDKKKLKKRRG